MIFFICWLLSAIVGALIGNAQGRPLAGAFWGFVLGPIGWLVIAFIPDERKRCTECLGVLVEDARKCRHCGSEVDQTAATLPASKQAGFEYHAGALAVFFVMLFAMLLWQQSQSDAIGKNARETFQRVANSLSQTP